MHPPALDIAREAGLGKHPAQRRGALVAFEQPERQFGGGDIGLGLDGTGGFGRVSHLGPPGNP